MRGTVLPSALACFFFACNCERPPAVCEDRDGDGVDNCSDCDDSDPTVFPGATEVCDGKDNTCEGAVDEGCDACSWCPVPANASARCVNGVCGRGPCKPGFFDFDGAKTFGCEARCTGRVCVDGAGNTVRVDTDPLPETGVVFQALASGSSYGAAVQTSSTHTNIAILGESTPPGPRDGAYMKNATHKHLGGFSAAQGK